MYSSLDDGRSLLTNVGAREPAVLRGGTLAMLLFKVLHILSMFAAVTFLLGESTYLAVAIWRGDVPAR
jgi:hypothetical protein